MSSVYVFETHRSFEFDLTPEELWRSLQQFERYPVWWPWMKGLRVRGEGIAEGTVLEFVVVTPIPYRMRIEVVVEGARRGREVRARVSGDLRGHARLGFEPAGTSTRARLEWRLEVRQAPMRVAARVARPLLQWGHDWAIGVAVASFQRHVTRPIAG